MAVAQWRAVVTDLSYVPQGELFNVSDRTLSMSLNRTDTLSLKVRADNPFADLLQGLDCYIKLYRNGTIMFNGLVLNSEETADSQGAHITVNAAGPGWVFPKRYVVYGTNSAGINGTRGNIMGAIITILNSQWNLGGTFTESAVKFAKTQGETGIRWDTTPNSGGTIHYEIQPYKPFSEMLDELSNATDGFDWRIKAYENWVNGALVAAPNNTKTGTLIQGAPIGTTKPEAIFEFADGRVNLKSYRRVKSRETQATEVIHLLNGQASDDALAASYNSEAIAGAGWISDIINADITDYTLRAALLNEHLEVRKTPRDLVEFEPSADYGDNRLPRFGIDYDIGDFVTGRARYGGKIRFNAQFRVWGVDWSIDANGVETPKLLLQYSS